MRYPPRKINYLTINHLIKIEDSSIINYSGENEYTDIIGYNLYQFIVQENIASLVIFEW